MLKQQIKDVVLAHYAMSAEPYLLSSLGKTLREQKLWPAPEEARSLRQVLKSYEPDLVLIADEGSSSFEAVVPPEYESVVRKAIDRRAELRALAKLPKSVIFAFCAKAEHGEEIYLNTEHPFDYIRSSEDPGSSYRRVAGEDRVPGLFVSNIYSLDPKDAEALKAGVERWMGANGLNIADVRRRLPSANEASSKAPTNALERLIAAQPEALASKMVIPLDIALILAREA